MPYRCHNHPTVGRLDRLVSREVYAIGAGALALGLVRRPAFGTLRVDRHVVISPLDWRRRTDEHRDTGRIYGSTLVPVI